MNLKDLDLAKLSKLTSDYTDELKCIECCKYYIAPATAACGHTLCHACWRARRTCPECRTSLDRKALKLNLPLQALTTHIQTLGEAFEKLFRMELDEFTLDSPGDIESEKDGVKNVKEWLISSQNHFSAPPQNSETFSQDSQQPSNAIEISTSKIIVHTDVKKVPSPTKVTKVVQVAQPQDDWDKIEVMPEVEELPKTNEIIVGPMDIEPFFIDDNEYTTDHPRRSSRKRDVKHDTSNKKATDLSGNKNNSRESSCENDKKSQKGKQPWQNVKRMKKEFSKLNKKNRSKLNVSIEMVKKTQNVKPINNTPVIANEQVINIDENTPAVDTDKENERITIKSSDYTDQNQEANSSTNIKENNNDNIVLDDIPIENNKIIKDVTSKETENVFETENNSNDHDNKMKFIKKSALCPKNIQITTDTVSNIPEQQTINSDDIEISIKIGNTTTNIVIKKKNKVQVKINTDREVQTSLGPQNDTENDNNHNIDINIENGKTNNVTINKTNTQKNDVNKSNKPTNITQIVKDTTDKKGTASADTATAQFEITESVEKELSNVMEYETAEGHKNIPVNIHDNSKAQVENIEENLENIDDLDIFSGSVKEANIHVLKDHAPSEILISTVKSKTQKKRIREMADEEVLPTNKKLKVTLEEKVQDKSVLPDSEQINYDMIMGQVFASIDADMEDIRKSQDTQNLKEPTIGLSNEDGLKSKVLSEAQQTQIIKAADAPVVDLAPQLNEKHSENVFSMIEKDDESTQTRKDDKIPEVVEDLLTPVVCRYLNSSQESQDGIQRTNKSNKKTQDYDSDRSVVEETPQKDISFPKVKRTGTPNQSQIALSETKKIPSKGSTNSAISVVNLTDSVTEMNKSKDITIIEPAQKKLTLETPLTITKFADHIIHKSTPVARKSLNFDNENDDNDPEQTLCPTSEVAKTTLEKEFMSKAFENTPVTPTARPLMARNIISKANRKYCLAASRLTSEEIVKVKILCAQHKWTYTEKYSKDVTHLVVSVDEENKSQRSVKYMCALADSKWIVSFEWILRCLQRKDIVDEEQFEALDSFGEPGPRRSRIAKQKLFQGIKFYCMPPFSVLDVVTLKNMLTAAGGRVVKEIKDVRVTKDSAQPALLLAEPEHTQEDRFIYLAMEQSIVPVNFEWVLNCLGSYSLGSIQELLLCPSSLLPTVTARWPQVLLAHEYS